MPTQQVSVGPPSAASLPDSQTPSALLGGKQGEAIVSALHGKYYSQNSRGNVFYGSNAGAGAAFTIFSNATFVGLLLWNPTGSGKNLSLIRCNLGLNSQASTACSGWGYAWINNAGSSTVQGGIISAFTAITASRGSGICGLGGQGSSVALLGSGGTFTTALLWGRAASFGSSTGAITVGLGTSLVEDFDGMMIVPPGTIFAVTSAILTGWTAVATLFWEETPI